MRLEWELRRNAKLAKELRQRKQPSCCGERISMTWTEPSGRRGEGQGGSQGGYCCSMAMEAALMVVWNFGDGLGWRVGAVRAKMEVARWTLTPIQFPRAIRQAKRQ